MKKKIILITGGDGMVGREAHFGIRLSHKQLDILNKKSIERAVNKYKPNVILHLAAMVNMLDCENNKKKAYEINVIGTKNLVEICKKNNIKLVYMSTCTIFDDKKKTPYIERDMPHPLNVYSQTKFLGEKIIETMSPNYLIIRTGWLFGGTQFQKKFITSIFQKLKNGEEVRATSDRHGSPTYIPDLLRKVEHLINTNKTGIYHIVNSGIGSYFDVAKEIKKIKKFKTNIKAIKSKEVEDPKLKRAKMEALKSSKVKLRPWKSALQEYINTLV